MCAFPLHAWAIVLAFRDLSWLMERTNAWDAIGVLSYALVFAFVESMLLFLMAVLLGLIIPKNWSHERRIGLLTALVLVLSLWAMISQLYFLAGLSPAAWFVQMVAQNSHPLRVLYVMALLVVAPSFLIPAYLILRSDKSPLAINGLIERLSLLASVYLFFDVVGLLIVVIRNLS